MSAIIRVILPILYIGSLVLFFVSPFIKLPKKGNITFSFIILAFGLTTQIIVAVLIAKLDESSRLCNLDPDCMNESGMVYIVYYFLLFIGSLILIAGLVKVIKAFRHKNKEVK